MTTSKLDRDFTGEQGRQILLRSLQLTQLIGDTKVIAEEFAEKVDLVPCQQGQVLIWQNGDDDDLHLILAGRFKVTIDDQEIAIVGAGGHVGELALIDPRAYRCASVVALCDSVTARLSQTAFVEIANRHPQLWRRSAQILGDRLRDLNRFVYPSNPRPQVFLGCASRDLGAALEKGLKHESFVLRPFLSEKSGSSFPVELLRKATERADFGIIACTPGDLSPSGAGPEPGARDNLFLLCGSCVGSMGPSRTVLVEPAGLTIGGLGAAFGIGSLHYSCDSRGALPGSLDILCAELQRTITERGPR